VVVLVTMVVIAISQQPRWFVGLVVKAVIMVVLLEACFRVTQVVKVGTLLQLEMLTVVVELVGGQALVVLVALALVLVLGLLVLLVLVVLVAEVVVELLM
jgi:hypothetical protein